MSYQEREGGELREYLDVIRARKWTILIVFVLVLGAALALSFRQTPQYIANTRLLVAGIPNDSTGITPTPDLGTEAEVVRSVEVARLVREDLDIATSPSGAENLLGGLSVEPITDTQVLSISYTSSDPQVAADAANSFANQYIVYKQEGAREALEPEFEKLVEQKKDKAEELEGVRDAMDEAQKDGNLSEVARLEQRQTELIVEIETLEQRITSTDPSRGIALGGGSILEPAGVPSEPSAPNHRADAILGGLLAGLLALGAGFAKDRLDSRFRSRVDAERTLSSPVLATVPRYKISGKSQEKTIVLSNPRASATEAYRTLRTNLQFLSAQRDVKSVVVTSPASSDGKTVTTANLGAALGQAGQKVVLISADLRRPALETYFGLDGHEPGLSSWLAGGNTELKELVKKTSVDNVWLLPCGPIPQNPAELLTSMRLNRLIEELGQHFDIVLFDAVPTLALADAAIIASRADAAVLVIDASKTHRAAALHSKEELERVGAHVLGVVMNMYDTSGSPYYYYNYSGKNAPASVQGNGATKNQAPPNGKKAKRSFFSRRR